MTGKVIIAGLGPGADALITPEVTESVLGTARAISKGLGAAG